MAEADVTTVRLAALTSAISPPELSFSGDRYELGRSALRDVTVRLETVSRLHAAVERRADGYWLADLGSANGTFLNGQRLAEPHRLADGDLIGLGGPEPLLRFLEEALTVRREEAAAPAPRLQFDPAGLNFTVDGRPLPLPPTQLRLLHHLVSHAGQVCSRESCAQAAWGRPYDPLLDRDALDKVVSKLRRRLAEADPRLGQALQSRRGEGYMLQMPGAGARFS